MFKMSELKKEKTPIMNSSITSGGSCCALCVTIKRMDYGSRNMSSKSVINASTQTEESFLIDSNRPSLQQLQTSEKLAFKRRSQNFDLSEYIKEAEELMQKHGKRMFCKFCRNNKEDSKVYNCHNFRDKNGHIRCPMLRGYVCPICNASSDGAHTIKYCPVFQRKLKHLEIQKYASK